MNQILTDEETAECLMPNIGEPYAIAGRRNVRVFARAVETAVLAKIEPLLRRALDFLDGYDDDDMFEDEKLLANDIREVLGETLTTLPPLPDCAGHMYPSDLEQFQRREMVANAYSVAFTNIETHERTVFIYTAEQMEAYARQAVEAALGKNE